MRVRGREGRGGAGKCLGHGMPCLRVLDGLKFALAVYGRSQGFESGMILARVRKGQ